MITKIGIITLRMMKMISIILLKIIQRFLNNPHFLIQRNLKSNLSNKLDIIDRINTVKITLKNMITTIDIRMITTITSKIYFY